MNIKAIAALGVLLCGVSHAAVYTVTSYADSGPGTLRNAIMASNASPSATGNTIQILAVGAPPYVIRPSSFLPPIVGPATVIGSQKGLVTAIGPSIAIDGSNLVNGDDATTCPGTTGGSGPNVRSVFGPGLAVVDSGNVRITNLEIRQFCIGLLSLRSHDNRFDHNYIHNMAGAAGVVITGDAGDAAGSSTQGLSVNNVIEYNTVTDTGDGMECTRGTSNSTYRGNVMTETRTRPAVAYSQGIECAGSFDDRIYIVGNTIIGYSDGLQLNSMTNGVVAGNTITGVTYGITWSGSGVAIGNTLFGNRMGIGPSGATSGITITQNRIFDNGHAEIISRSDSAGGTTNLASPALLGIDFGVNGLTPNDISGCADGFPDCTLPQNFPVLGATSIWNGNGTVTMNGVLQSRPSSIYKIEFFASHTLNNAGFAEGEVYLGSVVATTNAAGTATFTFTSISTNPLGDGTTGAYFTSTATNLVTGSTSEFSAPISLSH
jgi:3-dehydroshikimate dehydratase